MDRWERPDVNRLAQLLPAARHWRQVELARLPVRSAKAQVLAWLGLTPAAQLSIIAALLAGNGRRVLQLSVGVLTAMPPTARIYLSPPHMSPRERELLIDAFDSNWIAPLGPHVDAFEREFAEKLGVRARRGPLQRHRRLAPRSAGGGRTAW